MTKHRELLVQDTCVALPKARRIEKSRLKSVAPNGRSVRSANGYCENFTFRRRHSLCPRLRDLRVGQRNRELLPQVSGGDTLLHRRLPSPGTRQYGY